jgi:hypothetical protein
MESRNLLVQIFVTWFFLLFSVRFPGMLFIFLNFQINFFLYKILTRAKVDRVIYPLFCSNKGTNLYLHISRGRHGHDRVVIGFTTTYAIGAYHH